MDSIERPMPGPSEVELGRHFSELRRALSLNLDQVAGRSGLGVEVILELEVGRHEADLVTLRKLAEGLGLQLGVVFTLWERQVFVRTLES